MTDALDPVYAAALRADMAQGLALLDAIPPSELDARQRAAADTIRSRFAADEPRVPADLPPRTSALLAAYRRYWRQAMRKVVPSATAEAELLSGINRSLASGHADLDAATAAARDAIEAEQLCALTGMTLPLYELMIWKRSTPVTYAVELPEERARVTVVFLEDFVSLGWAAFATADRSHTGGWATATELYAVREAYDIDSETFRVSYLAHEAQHFADYRRYPKLAQPELEYRAKLAELAVSDATALELAARFAARTGPDRAVPHHFADHWLTRALGEALGVGAPAQADPAAIRDAARDLLFASSRALDARGAATVERWLGE